MPAGAEGARAWSNDVESVGVIGFGKGVDLLTPLGYLERYYQRRRGVNRDQ